MILDIGDTNANILEVMKELIRSMVGVETTEYMLIIMGEILSTDFNNQMFNTR